jgi:GT2 family glycosyltransferase
MDSPKVSVVVLTWNSRSLVGEAVDSALAQEGGRPEVLVADNASEDGTADAVAQRFGEQVRVVRFERNEGYAGGYNRALALARGEFLLLLNPDARLAPDFLARALPAFDDARVGIVAGRLMRPDGTTVDSAGQFLARSRRVIDRGYGAPLAASAGRPGPVLSACGAAALYRRAMVDDIRDGDDFFDPDYFAFHEDLEVGWRAWRAGWSAVYVPEATAVHLRGGGAAAGALGRAVARPAWQTAHIVKNRYLAMLRHDRLGALLLDAPFVLGRDLALWSVLLARKPAVLKLVAGHREAFGRALAKRRADAARRGRFGPWRRAVPRRGIWPAPREATP